MRVIVGLPAESDPMRMVCEACKEGPFNRENFRKAIKKDWGDEEITNFADDDQGSNEDEDSYNDDGEEQNEDEGNSDNEDEEDPNEEEDDENLNDPHEGEDDWVDPNEAKEDENKSPADDVAPKYQYNYTRTWGDISKSVTKEDCHWCKLLIAARNRLPDAQFPRGGPDETVDIRMHIRIQTPVDWMDVTNWVEIHLNGFKAAVYYIYAEPEDAASKDVGLGTHFRNKPSYVDYQQVKECLENCSRNHDTCPKALETVLPTRVIDCSDPCAPRLFETHRKMKGHYVTLSYAWGGEQVQKTLKSRLHTYIHDGLPKDLPQTIADAITATHKLGIRWLWIDAMCIIQDSPEDKLRELADMGHIYQDSYVTLSILSSFRADQGFLVDAGDHPVLPFHCADGNVGSIKLRFHIERPERGRLARYQTVAVYDPLRHRAWCFQETTLSARRVVFQPPGVMYACRGYEQDITRPEEGGDSGPAERIPMAALFSDQKHGTALRDNESMQDLWSHLINRYTSCQISWAADKLVAFSSVAEVYQAITKDDYVAGLWKRDLLDGLLWKPTLDAGERPTEWRAPTWSWASIDADSGVTMHTRHILETPSTEYEASVIDVTVVPKSELHPLGELTEATLKLKAKVHPLMKNGKKCRFTEEKPIETDYSTHKLVTGGGWIPPRGNCLDMGLFQFDSKEGTEQDRDMDFHVIALRAGKTWGDQPQPGFMLGLLVLKTNDTFRRVGRIDLQHYPDWLDDASLKAVTVV